MLTAIRESEENYKKEQEQARIREEQLRSARQTSRPDINLYPTLANSTPIINTDTRSDQPGVHFSTNPVHHVYATTSDRGEQYKPPENDSILQGATSSPAVQFTTNATDTAGRDKPWRQNNTTNISSNTYNHRTTTRPTGCNGLQTNNPSNPTDLRTIQRPKTSSPKPQHPTKQTTYPANPHKANYTPANFLKNKGITNS